MSCLTSSSSSEDDSDTEFSSSSSKLLREPLAGAYPGALSFTRTIAEISWTIESKKIIGRGGLES